MTEKPNSPSGLSFFEDPADRPDAEFRRCDPDHACSPERGKPASAPAGLPQFALVRRGYDKDSVDAFLAQNEAAKSRAISDLSAARAELDQLRERVAELELRTSSKRHRPTPAWASMQLRCFDWPKNRPPRSRRRPRRTPRRCVAP